VLLGKIQKVLRVADKDKPKAGQVRTMGMNASEPLRKCNLLSKVFEV
jgi:hypothetical protein